MISYRFDVCISWQGEVEKKVGKKHAFGRVDLMKIP
jgi:hypothetical protein